MELSDRPSQIIIFNYIICQRIVMNSSSIIPGRCVMYLVQLLPNVAWRLIRISSSLEVQGERLISGLRWLTYRSLHCLPVLLGISLAIFDLVRIYEVSLRTVRCINHMLTRCHSDHMSVQCFQALHLRQMSSAVLFYVVFRLELGGVN